MIYVVSVGVLSSYLCLCVLLLGGVLSFFFFFFLEVAGNAHTGLTPARIHALELACAANMELHHVGADPLG